MDTRDTKEWFLEVEGERTGPYPEDSVIGLFQDGEILPHHFVLHESSDGHLRLTVQEFIEAHAFLAPAQLKNATPVLSTADTPAKTNETALPARPSLDIIDPVSLQTDGEHISNFRQAVFYSRERGPQESKSPTKDLFETLLERKEESQPHTTNSSIYQQSENKPHKLPTEPSQQQSSTIATTRTSLTTGPIAAGIVAAGLIGLGAKTLFFQTDPGARIETSSSSNGEAAQKLVRTQPSSPPAQPKHHKTGNSTQPMLLPKRTGGMERAALGEKIEHWSNSPAVPTPDTDRDPSRDLTSGEPGPDARLEILEDAASPPAPFDTPFSPGVPGQNVQGSEDGSAPEMPAPAMEQDPNAENFAPPPINP